MRAPPARAAALACPPVRLGARRPAPDKSLALPQPTDIACGQRGKGGGPTACIAVGLARWLSASRRPAGAPAVASARRCDHWPSLVHLLGVAGVPQGGGRRIHGRHRAPGLAGLVQPVPVWPASHPVEQDVRVRAAGTRHQGCAAYGHTGGARGSLFAAASLGAVRGGRQDSPRISPTSARGWRRPLTGARSPLRPSLCA
jgi:hypothetical protein